MSILSKEEVRAYLEGRNDAELFARADEAKEQQFGKEIFLRAIIEFPTTATSGASIADCVPPTGTSRATG